MTDFYIDSQPRQQIRTVLHLEGDGKTHTFDFSPWADDNGTLTTATWTVKAGSATVSGEALSGNVASAVITTPNAGTSIINLSATDGTHIQNVRLHVGCKDPQGTYEDDYGMCRS